MAQNVTSLAELAWDKAGPYLHHAIKTDVRQVWKKRFIKYCKWGLADVNKSYNIESHQNVLCGDIPLHWAASYGRTQCIVELNKVGVDLQVRDQAGCNALFYAHSHDQEETTKVLIDLGLDLTYKTDLGFNFFEWVINGYDLDTLKYLIKSGLDINQFDPWRTLSLLDWMQQEDEDNQEEDEIKTDHQLCRVAMHLHLRAAGMHFSPYEPIGMRSLTELSCDAVRKYLVRGKSSNAFLLVQQLNGITHICKSLILCDVDLDDINTPTPIETDTDTDTDTGNPWDFPFAYMTRTINVK